MPRVSQCSPHFFDDRHLLERALEAVGGCADRIDRREPSRFGGGSRVLAGNPCHFRGLPHQLPLRADGFERLAMLIANVPGLFGKLPELLRFVPARLRRSSIDFGGTAALLGRLTAVLRFFTRALGVLRVIDWLIAGTRHGRVSLAGYGAVEWLSVRLSTAVHVQSWTAVTVVACNSRYPEDL